MKPEILTCICGAACRNTAKERGRFLRRHSYTGMDRIGYYEWVDMHREKCAEKARQSMPSKEKAIAALLRIESEAIKKAIDKAESEAIY